MSANGQSLSSNNPFRRKFSSSSNQPGDMNTALGADRPLGSPPTSASFTTFKSAVPEDERLYEEAQPVQQVPRKITKKVRVQSPPSSPSLPDEAVPVTRRSSKNDDSDSDSASDSDDSDESPERSDPFDTGAVNIGIGSLAESPLPRMPPNPFSRTLEDAETTGRAHEVKSTSTNSSKGLLDVQSFKRLLLTGHADLPEPAHTPNTADADLMSNQPARDTRQTALGAFHENSESETSDDHKSVQIPYPIVTVPTNAARKKPPPPSSRYGKLIKLELGVESDSGVVTKAITPSSPPDLRAPAGTTSRKSSSESPLPSLQEAASMNKPLPAIPPQTSIDENIESPFDREAAGKVPEPFPEQQQAYLRSPTSPSPTRSRSASQTSTQSFKPAAPPPRRQGRGDGRVSSTQLSPQYTDEDPPRSSIDSSRSQTEALRAAMNAEKFAFAPAPPPPRRIGHTRQANSVASSSSSFAGLSPTSGPGEKERALFGSNPASQPGYRNSMGPTTSAANGLAKLRPPPPPPPPMRKQSVRRPPSVRSMEITNGPPPLPPASSSSSSSEIRRVSREKDGPAPPPPPPRSRASRIYSDTPVEQEARRDSASSSVSVSTENESAASTVVVESGTQGQEILADLDALRREVDAFMKKSAGS